MPHPPSATEAFVEKEAGYRSAKPPPKNGHRIEFSATCESVR